MSFPSSRRPAVSAPVLPDPRLLRLTCGAALLGLALVALVPAARGCNPWLGWWPLWLVGMPLAAWWALYRFRLPAWQPREGNAPRLRRGRRPAAQARRFRPRAAGVPAARTA